MPWGEDNHGSRRGFLPPFLAPQTRHTPLPLRGEGLFCVITSDERVCSFGVPYRSISQGKTRQNLGYFSVLQSVNAQVDRGKNRIFSPLIIPWFWVRIPVGPPNKPQVASYVSGLQLYVRYLIVPYRSILKKMGMHLEQISTRFTAPLRSPAAHQQPQKPSACRLVGSACKRLSGNVRALRH